MDVHIAIELHVRRDRLADLRFVQLEVFVFENTVSSRVWHDVSNGRVKRIPPLWKTTEDFDIPVVIVSVLVIEQPINPPSVVDERIERRLWIVKNSGEESRSGVFDIAKVLSRLVSQRRETFQGIAKHESGIGL